MFEVVQCVGETVEGRGITKLSEVLIKPVNIHFYESASQVKPLLTGVEGNMLGFSPDTISVGGCLHSESNTEAKVNASLFW